jgi:hypothetical protein
MTATDPSRLSGAVVASRFVPLLTTREDDVLITGTVHVLAGEERQLTIAVVPDAEVLATADLRIRSEPWTSGPRLPKAWWAPVESVTTRWPGSMRRRPSRPASSRCWHR